MPRARLENWEWEWGFHKKTIRKQPTPNVNDFAQKLIALLRAVQFIVYPNQLIDQELKKYLLIYTFVIRLQNSPYFCVFKYARAVKQKVSNKAENRERDWGETLYWFWEKNRLFCSLIRNRT